jgi:hypothetical protein
MLRTLSTLTLGLLVLTGCPGDDTGTTNGGTAGSTSAGSSTTESAETNPPGTTAGDTADTSVNPDTTVSPDSTDGPGTMGTTETPGETTEAPGTSEDSGTAGVDECGMCVQESCPDELAECMMDVDCTCFQDCAQMNPGQAGAITCAMECGVFADLLNPDTTIGALVQCTMENCPKCVE